MAQQALVLDASVGVKWFSDKDEASLRQALAIRDAHISQQRLIVVPDLFYYEVANAITQKKFIPTDTVQSAVAALYALNLRTVPVDGELLARSVDLSRKYTISVYDSCYVAVALSCNCSLVTANPRHQGQVPDCIVIPIEQWKEAG